MRTVGIALVFAATALRGIVRYWDNPGRAGLLALLAIYGLLLLLTVPLSRVARPSRKRALLAAAGLLGQAACVMVLFAMGTGADFFAVLFVPLSLQAVMLFGGRTGSLWIAFFCAGMLLGLRGVEREPLFGLGMTAVYGGLCFLFGGYAYQMQTAQAARLENQRLLSELQSAQAGLQRYADQLNDLATEHERSRLARELHDSVTQSAFSMNLAVQSARLLLDRDAKLLAVQLEKVEQLAGSAIGEIQNLVSELSAARPAVRDLRAALAQLAQERERRDGLRVTLQVSGAEALPDDVVKNLYAIAQEALTNAARHSGACEATVRLIMDGSGRVLEIEDAGKGFEPDSQARGPGHLGLAAMQERAREIGWELRVESRPGAGTRIRALGRGTRDDG